MLTADGDAGRMNLCETWIAKESAAPMRSPDGGGVRALGVGGKIENVAIPSGREDNDVGGVGLDRAGYEIAGDNAARLAVYKDKVKHLAAGAHLDGACGYLLFERLIRA